MYDIWLEHIAAFDKTVEDDNWDRLVPFFHEDIRYFVTGAPFACDIQGRDAVFAGFKKSLDGLDRKFDKRDWRCGEIMVSPPNLIKGTIIGTYEMTGKPPLQFGVQSIWGFTDDKISLMVDLYDISRMDAINSLDWLEEHGVEFDLDASYV